MNRNSYNQIDSAKVFTWVMLLTQIVSFVLVLFFSVIYQDKETMENSMFYILVASVIAQVCFAFVFIYYNKKNKINPFVACKLKTKVNWVNIIVCMLISIIAVFGLMNFISIFDYIFQKIGFSSNGLNLPLDNFGWFLLNVLLLAVLPALLEELIFRGIIFNGLRQRGFWFASIISTFMFAFMHLSIYQFVYPLIMGMVFCFVVEKTGSTLYSIIVHFCNNFIVILISYISNITGKSIEIAINSFLKIAVFVLIAIISVIIILLLTKILKNKNSNPSQVYNFNLEIKDMHKQNIENKTLNISLFLGIGIWLFYVISTLL